jgi:hypothetical protein
VPISQLLSLPGRQEARVDPAVMAHSQPATAQVDNLHCVRMTALRFPRMIMVAPVRRSGSTCRDFGHNPSLSNLVHNPPLSLWNRRYFACISTLPSPAIQCRHFVPYDPKLATQNYDNWPIVTIPEWLTRAVGGRSTGPGIRLVGLGVALDAMRRGAAEYVDAIRGTDAPERTTTMSQRAKEARAHDHP